MIKRTIEKSLSERLFKGKTIIYKIFSNRANAKAVEIRLKDNGFACFLSAEDKSDLRPLYSQVISFVQLNVLEKDVEAINKLLADEKNE